MPAELDFHHSFETCGVNWRLVSLCKAFILKITRMLFTAMCYNQSFTFSYKILCKLQGAKKPSTSVYHSRTKTFSKYYAQPRNDSIYDRSADSKCKNAQSIRGWLFFNSIPNLPYTTRSVLFFWFLDPNSSQFLALTESNF